MRKRPVLRCKKDVRITRPKHVKHATNAKQIGKYVREINQEKYILRIPKKTRLSKKVMICSKIDPSRSKSQAFYLFLIPGLYQPSCMILFTESLTSQPPSLWIRSLKNDVGFCCPLLEPGRWHPFVPISMKETPSQSCM